MINTIKIDVDSLFPPSPEKIYREKITRVPRNGSLRFEIEAGSSHLDSNLILFTNYPPLQQVFDRKKFYSCKR